MGFTGAALQAAGFLLADSLEEGVLLIGVDGYLRPEVEKLGKPVVMDLPAEEVPQPISFDAPKPPETADARWP